MAMISVIIPVYNTEQYLEKCINSVLEQTYQDMEIICIDDGSTDNSGMILDRYAEKDRRIKVIHQKNQGLVLARKAGLRYATGKYISHIDSDDWLEITMYEQMIKMAEKYDTDAVCCNYYDVKGTTKYVVDTTAREGLLDSETVGRLICQNLYDIKKTSRILNWTFWTYLFRRKILEQYQMNVTDWLETCEDLSCIWPFLVNAKRIYVLKTPLYNYRIREESSSRKRNSKCIEQVMEAHRIISEAFQRKNNSSYLSMIANNAFFDIIHLMSEKYFYGESGRFCLFPYEKIPTSSKIILYGAGYVGKSYYKQLQENQYCKIVLWVDQEYRNISNQSYHVDSPEKIINYKYDYILIAVQYMSTAERIKTDIVNKYHVVENKIVIYAPIQLSRLVSIDSVE